jgi:hypothetical protein
MQILALPKLRQGARLEELQRHRIPEIRAVWDLYAQGICARSSHARISQELLC